MIVYTAMFGDYDYAPVPRPHREMAPSVDFVCFTDSPRRIPPAGWHIVPVGREGRSAAMANRKLKILGHPVLEAYEVSLYIDANVALRKDPRRLLDRYMDHHPMAVPMHGDRSCIYEEAAACIALGKADARSVHAFVNDLELENYPRNRGLTENFFIARVRGDPDVERLMADWWRAVNEGPPRDQLHLQRLVWERNFPLAMIPRDDFDAWGGFRRFPHRPSHGPLRRFFFGELAKRYDTRIGQALENFWDLYSGRGRRK